MMLVEAHGTAPAVRSRSKTRQTEWDDQRALRHAAWLWRGTPIWIAVVAHGRVVGEVKGDPDRSRTLIRAMGFPYADYDHAVSRKTAGKHWAQVWYKTSDSAAVIDNWYDLWGVDLGAPNAGDWSGTARTARQFTNATQGAMYHGGAVSTDIKYLTRFSSACLNGTTVQSFLLYDRVLHYDACTMTAGSQNMTNTLAATRYITAGDPGLQICVTADTVHNATAANLTVLTYVNESGTGSRTVVTTPTLAKIASIAAPTTSLGARQVFQIPGGSTKGSLYLTLQAGDEGVISITNYTWSAAPTGTVSFGLDFPLALFCDGAVNLQASDSDFLFGIDAVGKRIYDDACLSLMYNPHNAVSGSMQGVAEFGW